MYEYAYIHIDIHIFYHDVPTTNIKNIYLNIKKKKHNRKHSIKIQKTEFFR